MIDLLQEIYASVKKNKLRTLLTGFAVAWGIFILIVLLGAGNGLLNAFKENSGGLSSNSISLYGGYTSVPSHGYQRGRSIDLKNIDIETVENQLGEYLYNGGGSFNLSRTVSSSTDYIAGNVAGTYPTYKDTEGLIMKEGRYINQADVDQMRRVIVIHEEAGETLFDKAEAIGQTLMIDSLTYQVIGTYEGKGFRSNSDFFIPIQTLKLIYNKDNLDQITFLLSDKITSEAQNEELEEKLRAVMGQQHKFDKEDKRALWIWNKLQQHLQQLDAATYLTIAIWVIGIFTLLSGVVGVSNIMLITVKERTKEFGIRKAIGAKPNSILRLVLVESVIITTFFGYIGMIAGIGATELLNSYMGNQTVDAGAFSTTIFTNPTVDISVAIQATLTLIIAGTIAGFIPARKAVKIKPVLALNAK